MTISSAASVRLMPRRSSRSASGLQQIGERHAGDERQQDIAQQPQQERRTRRKSPQPEQELLPKRHRFAPDRLGRRRSGSVSGFGRIHVAHPFAQIEDDRQQGQDRDQRHQDGEHRLARRNRSRATPARAVPTRSAPTVLSLETVSGLSVTGLSTSQDNMIGADDHDVARHHQDDQPARNRVRRCRARRRSTRSWPCRRADRDRRRAPSPCRSAWPGSRRPRR